MMLFLQDYTDITLVFFMIAFSCGGSIVALPFV
jgi:hypothetical protein